MMGGSRILDSHRPEHAATSALPPTTVNALLHTCTDCPPPASPEGLFEPEAREKLDAILIGQPPLEAQNEVVQVGSVEAVLASPRHGKAECATSRS